MTPPVAVFDLDRTITRKGTFTPFLLSSRESPARRWCLLARILPLMLFYKAGGLSRRALKDRMMAAALDGHDQDAVAAIAEHFTRRVLDSGLRPGAAAAIRAARGDGATLVLATAAPDLYAERLGRELGFDIVVCTRTAWRTVAGHWRLRIDGENCYGQAKLDGVRSALAQLFGETASKARITFYSDHHTDWPLFHWAHTAFAVNPTRKLKTVTRRRGIPVVKW